MFRRWVRLLWIPFLITELSAGELWLETVPARPGSGETVRIALRSTEESDGHEGSLERLTISRIQHLSKRSRSHLTLELATPLELKVVHPGVELLSCEAHDREGPGQHYAKALIVTGDADAGGTLHWSEVGQRLEIVLQSDPVLLARDGGALTVQVLFEREPLADLAVTAIALDGSGVVQRASTDEIGLALLRIETPGAWRINVVHDTTCRDCKGGLQRLRASLTLPIGSR